MEESEANRTDQTIEIEEVVIETKLRIRFYGNLCNPSCRYFYKDPHPRCAEFNIGPERPEGVYRSPVCIDFCETKKV